MNWQFSTRVYGDITIVDIIEVSTTLDKAQSDLRIAIKEIIEKGVQKILINLANVIYMDSSRIGDLVGSYTSAQKQSAELKFLRPPPHVYKLMAITRLTTIFEIFEDEHKAISSFQN